VKQILLITGGGELEGEEEKGTLLNFRKTTPYSAHLKKFLTRKLQTICYRIGETEHVKEARGGEAARAMYK